MLHPLAVLLMMATLALMAWSLYQGLGTQALFQFLLGASVALLFRRYQEQKQAQDSKTKRSERDHDHP